MTTFILALILLLLSGTFIAAEIAFVTIGQRRARQWAEEGSRSGQIVWSLMHDPSQLRATLLVAVTITLYAAGVLATCAALTLRWEWWLALVVVLTAIALFVSALLILYAWQRPEIVARLSAPLLRGASLLLYPLIALVNGLTHLFSRLCGVSGKSEQVTEEQILTAISVAEERGAIEEDEKEMLHGIIEFGDKTVSDVIVPREEIVYMEASATVGDALQLLIREKHSRMPVVRDDIDQVMGIVYVKDLLPYVRQSKMEIPVEKVARPPYFIRENKKVSTLLDEFRHHRRLMAVVIGERGKTVGLVTIEDLLEEIVGDILDEYDVEE